MSDFGNYRIRVSTLGDHLLMAADRVPDRPVLIFPDRRITYAEMVDAGYTAAARLGALGVGAGDAVGVLMANCIEYMNLIVGCSFLGAVAVPLNARYKSSELAYVIENADLKVLVTSDLISEYADFAELLHGAFPTLADTTQDPYALSLPEAPRLKSVVLLGRASSAGMLTEEAFHGLDGRMSRTEIDVLRVHVQPEQPAIMMYTSGTTADPKGCPLSHAILVRNGINMNRERFFLTEQDVFWAPLPMFHMASILPFMACVDAGAALVSMTHVDAGVALDLFERDQVTIAFPAFPTVMNDLITHPTFAARDLTNIRRLNNVAPIDVLRRFQDAMPQAVQTGAYGLTEVGGVIAFNHPDESLDVRLTTCGIPFPGIDVQIVDLDSMQPVADGEQGEIWVKGYCVFDGYHKSPEKNAESFHDGWFRTGDIGSIAPNGGIRFHGRSKDMLKVGGENVAALEIESHLAKHPAVQLAQVIGRQDARYQEVPVAFVERVPGQDVDEETLLAHCRGQMASFKVPRAIYFVSEWPMSSTKVQKFKLRDYLPDTSAS